VILFEHGGRELMEVRNTDTNLLNLERFRLTEVGLRKLEEQKREVIREYKPKVGVD